MEWAAELQNPEVRAELNRHVQECERKCSTGGRLGSIPQVCARARQRAMREQVKGQRCESSTGKQCAGDATGRVDPTGGYAGVPTVFLQHTRVSSGGLARE
jgi:hypothetical protein